MGLLFLTSAVFFGNIKTGEVAAVSKAMKAATVLQILYCVGCVIVLVCMPLYTAFYPTAFGEVCFRIGATLALFSALNPLGLICAIVNGVGYYRNRTEISDERKKNSIYIWVAVGPILTSVLWYLSLCSYIYHSGI